jgi:hypothetical protein
MPSRSPRELGKAIRFEEPSVDQVDEAEFSNDLKLPSDLVSDRSCLAERESTVRLNFFV